MNFSQQRDLAPDASGKVVTLMGAGSVGSHVANMLVRIGVVRLCVYDADSVDSHNVPSSLYGVGDIARFKVDALASRLARDCEVAIDARRAMYDGGEPLRGTVIACVDTMEARQLIWQKVENNPFVDLLVDTRVSEHFAQVFFVRPCNPEARAHYRQFLTYGSSEASQQFCGRHSVVFMSAQVASIAVAGLAKFWECGRTHTHVEFLSGAPMSIIA